MSKITLEPNSSGTGTFSIQSPSSNSNRVLTLPDNDGTVLSDVSDLNGSNITGSINGSLLSGDVNASLLSGTINPARMPAGSIIQVAFDSTNALTSTTSKSGFEAMRATLTPISTSSQLLIIGNVYGAAGDDSHAWLEYRINNGSWIRNTELNGSENGGAAFADFSVTRVLSEPDQQVGYGTSVIFSPNTTSSVDIRVICTAENDNGGGFRLNIGSTGDTSSSYNNTTTKSTLVIMEIA